MNVCNVKDGESNFLAIIRHIEMIWGGNLLEEIGTVYSSCINICICYSRSMRGWSAI
jgi:hypothetical protein